MMKEFTVGFLFAKELEHVVLIRKQRPSWQKGLLNGVGGHIEQGETPQQCQAREMEEETGVKIPAVRWVRYCEIVVTSKQSKIYFFYAISENGADALCRAITTKTDERVWLYPVSAVNLDIKVVPNLKVLVPLALHTHTNKVEHLYIP